MELIKEIYEGDIEIENKVTDVTYKVRKAARTILLNEAGEIALLYVSNGNYHKLPGGGIKQEENVVEALKREVKEEKVKGELESTSFTEKELSDGFQLKWVPFNEALDIINNDKPANYVGKFMHNRDLAFVNKAKEIVNV